MKPPISSYVKRVLQQTMLSGDELGYYVLTGKIEGIIRDRLSMHLHKHLQDLYGNTLVVLREYRRCDVAILCAGNSKNATLIELKAFGSGEFFKDPSTRKSFPLHLYLDINKMSSLELDAEFLIAFTVACVSGERLLPPNILKYESGAFNLDHMSQIPLLQQQNQVDCVVKQVLGASSIIDNGWREGSCFGAQVALGYWLFNGNDLRRNDFPSTCLTAIVPPVTRKATLPLKSLIVRQVQAL